MTTQLQEYRRDLKTAKTLIQAVLKEELESLERIASRDESIPHAIATIKNMLGRVEQTSSMGEIGDLFDEVSEQLEMIQPVNTELKGKVAGLEFVRVALIDAVKG